MMVMTYHWIKADSESTRIKCVLIPYFLWATSICDKKQNKKKSRNCKKSFYTWLKGKCWCTDENKMQQSATKTDLAN